MKKSILGITIALSMLLVGVIQGFSLATTESSSDSSEEKPGVPGCPPRC